MEDNQLTRSCRATAKDRSRSATGRARGMELAQKCTGNQDLRGILLLQRMLGRTGPVDRTRGMLAACLAVVLLAATLPAERSPDPSASSCCRSHCKRCCKAQAKDSAGPAISSRCSNDCDRLTVGAAGNARFAPPATQSMAHRLRPFSTIQGLTPATASQLSDCVLRQRPPPAPVA